MVRLRVVEPDGRSASERAQALHRVRDSPDARARLAQVLAHLRQAQVCIEQLHTEGRDPVEDETFWTSLDEAYLALDRYLAELLHEAAIDPSCGSRCSACCTDAPPVLAVEALRVARALRELPEGEQRLQRASEQAAAFIKLLRERVRVEHEPIDTSDPRYRRAQLAWRHLGYRCPVLGEDGNCSAYEARPLACRVHYHVEDPAYCEPSNPRFLAAERPPVWGHPREAEVELILAAISRLLELEPVPNLQLGLSRCVERENPQG